MKLIKFKQQDLNELAELGNDNNQETSDLKPYFTANQTGVWFHGVGVDKQGNVFAKPPVRICDPFYIIGRGQGQDGREYRIISYQRNGRGAMQNIPFPMGLVGRNDGMSFLRDLGIGIKERHKGELWDYVQWDGKTDEWQIVARGGWTDKTCTTYVLPSGEIIGNPENKVIYTGDTSKKDAYSISGSLNDWQREVGQYLQGNSRPLLALGAIFAAPLLGVLREESGGFHFYGQSSKGKSLTGILAMSAVGEPIGLKVQWKGTGLGFDNYAAANNDGTIFLDEISECKPEVVKDTAYSIFNGVSKLQGAKQGGNRTQITWRVLAISTGEFDAEHYLKQDGIEWNAGQAVRLPAIPADAGKGFGVFDTLHGFHNGMALALHLEDAAKRFYGAPFRAFLAELTAQMTQQPEQFIQRINTLRAEFTELLPPDLDTQPARTAKRFILAATALELASEWGITGFAKGVGAAGVLQCFTAWYERDGVGNREERQIIKNTRNFLDTYGRSERFLSLIKDEYEIMPQTGKDHAGYRVAAAGDDALPRFFITDAVFEKEICHGFDVKFVCEVLHEHGWLVREDVKRQKYKLPPKLTAALRLPKSTRMYCLHGFTPQNEWHESHD